MLPWEQTSAAVDPMTGLPAPWPPTEWTDLHGPDVAPAEAAMPGVEAASVPMAGAEELLDPSMGSEPMTAAAWPPPDWGMGGAGAFGIAPSAPESPAMARAGATLDRIGEQYGLAPTPRAEVDRSAAFDEQYGAPPTLDEEANRQLASGYERPTGPEFAPLDPMTVEEEAAFQYDRGPEYVAQQGLRIEQERTQRANEQTADALRRDEELATATRQRYERARREADAEKRAIAADSKRLSEEKVDPTRWWSNASTGQQVGAALAVIFGGLSRRGRDGQNDGLALLERLINQDVELQKGELARRDRALDDRRGAVADLAAQGVEDYRAAETARMASYQRIGDRIRADAALYDPRGTQAQERARMAVEWDARQAAAMAKAEEEADKRAMERAEFDMKVARFRKEMAPKSSGPRRLSPKEQMDLAAAGYLPTLDANGQIVRDPSAKPGESEADLRIRKLRGEATKAESDAEKALRENSDEERERVLGVGGLKRKDGKPILIRSTEEAAKLAKLKGATDMATQLIDQIIVARDSEGFSSETLKSDAWRQMQADYTALQLQIKNTAELGVLAGPDMVLIEKALGTSDPTELRDVTAGMKSARANLVNQFNATLLSNEEEAARYEPTKLEPAKALERTKDQNAAIITQGIPPHARTDPEARARYLDAKKSATDVAVRRQAPAPAELKGWAKQIDAQVKSGELTREEAIAIVTPMASRVIEAERRSIQDASTEDLLKAQKDPGFRHRALILGLAQDGKASPDDVYRLLVEGP